MIYNGYEIKLCDNNHVNNNIIIKDFNYEIPNFKRKIKYLCDICKEEYITGNSIKSNYRKICKKHHFYYVCDYCHKEFEIMYLSDFINSKNDLRFCSHNCTLQYRNRTDKMKNIVHNMNCNRAKDNKNIVQECKICGNKFKSIFKMDICNSCIATNVNKNNFNKNQICQKCGKVFHSSFIMKLGPCCNPNIGGIPNFITHDNVKYYKGEKVENIIEKLDSGEYKHEDFPGWNKRFGEWYYNSQNILTGDFDKLNNSNFYVKDKLYYYDKTINDYVPWDYYKEKFKTSSKNIILPDDFELIQTFRSQDSFNWEGASNAFEQNLIDNNIGWFVYIKFYINSEGKSLPLVCGKTGSKLVNSSGSDVNFSEDICDGPARRFLHETKTVWNKEQIAILKCNTEEEAYILENFYINKLKLFSS